MNKWLYLLIGAVTFLVCLAMMTPASFVLSFVRDDLTAVDGLQLGATRGTAWAGSVESRYEALPTTRVSWDLSPLPLVTGVLAADINMQAAGLTANYGLEAEDTMLVIDALAAELEGAYLNPMTVPYGLDLSGTFSINVPGLTVVDGWPVELEGELTWTGGIVHIETPQQFYSVKLPPLDGKLSLAENRPRLEITDAGRPLMRIDVGPDGWAKVSVDYALIELTGLLIPGASSGQAGPAFVLEEKIF